MFATQSTFQNNVYSTGLSVCDSLDLLHAHLSFQNMLFGCCSFLLCFFLVNVYETRTVVSVVTVHVLKSELTLLRVIPAKPKHLTYIQAASDIIQSYNPTFFPTTTSSITPPCHPRHRKLRHHAAPFSRRWICSMCLLLLLLNSCHQDC